MSDKHKKFVRAVMEAHGLTYTAANALVTKFNAFAAAQRNLDRKNLGVPPDDLVEWWGEGRWTHSPECISDLASKLNRDALTELDPVLAPGLIGALEAFAAAEHRANAAYNTVDELVGQLALLIKKKAQAQAEEEAAAECPD